jgi:hypothetical protein
MSGNNWTGNRKRKSIPINNIIPDQMVAKATKVSSKSKSASAAAKVASKKSVSASLAAKGIVQSSAMAISVQDRAARSISIVSGSFLTPVPGVHGACDYDFLKGKKFVITGTFPGAAGGDVGAEGKTIVKSMVQSFGGKVTMKFSTKQVSKETLNLYLSLVLQEI